MSELGHPVCVSVTGHPKCVCDQGPECVCDLGPRVYECDWGTPSVCVTKAPRCVSVTGAPGV